MKNKINENESAKWFVILSERGASYTVGTRIKEFRGKLYVHERGSKTVDVFNLPLPMIAEVQTDLPLAQTPFHAKFKPGFEIPKTRTETTDIITNQEVFNRLMEMDIAYVGTKNYMGLAYFWNCEYKHTLRDCNVQSRVAVHAAWLANGMDLSGVSKKHETVMRLALKQIAEAIRKEAA